MSSRFLRTCAAMISLAAGLFPAVAADPKNAELGGMIEGTEDLGQIVPLKPTGDAPPGALGVAHLEAANDHGSMTEVLDIEVEGLAAGNYTVSMVPKPDGQAVALGPLSVEASHGNASSNAAPRKSHIQFGTGTSMPFSDEINSMGMAAVVVMTETGAEVLRGDLLDLTGLTHNRFNSYVTLERGFGAPNATGKVVIHALTKRGANRGTFSLLAWGTPPGTALTLRINGNDVGVVRTDRAGKLRLRKLPIGVDIGAIVSLELSDASGDVLLSASF